MIQDIGDHRYDNSYRPQPARPADVVLTYRDGLVLARSDGGKMELPHLSDFGDAVEASKLTYCFAIDDVHFYLCEDEKVPVPQGYAFEGIPALRGARPRWRAFAAITGYQLRNWYRDNRFCGRCGHPTERVSQNRELCCPSCNKVVYPKIQPAVICGVTHGSKLLLTKYAGRSYTNYALVAGFNEVGESLEQTCRREIMEEVGIHVRNIRYYKDQPWSFTDTLLAGFFCELDGTSDITLDRHELALGTWVDRSEIPERLPDTSSLTNEMILFFRNHPEAF